MKKIFLLFFITFLNLSFSQDIYSLISADDVAYLVISSPKGVIKKQVPLDSKVNPRNDVFALTGMHNKIFCAGNVVINGEDEISQAYNWVFDLNGNLLDQFPVGIDVISASLSTNINGLAAFEDKLYSCGYSAVETTDLATYGLFIVADTQGNTLFEWNIYNDSPATELSAFNSIAVTKERIYIIGPTYSNGGNNTTACLWILDHKYNLVSRQFIGTPNNSNSWFVNVEKDKLYVCGDDSGVATFWVLDLDGNQQMKVQSTPQAPNNLSTAKNAVFLKGEYYISGYDYEDQPTDVSSFLWVVDVNGNLITKNYISQNSDGDSGYPISKIGNIILYGNNEINSEEAIDEAALLYFDENANQVNEFIFNVGTNNLYYDIYVPDFNFLYKSLQMFNPVKNQKGL